MSSWFNSLSFCERIGALQLLLQLFSLKSTGTTSGQNFLPPTQKTKPKRDEIGRVKGGKRIDETQFVAFFSSHPLIQTRFIFNRRLFEDGMEKNPLSPHSSFFPSSFLIYSLFLASHSDLNIFYLANFQRVVIPLPSFPVVTRSLPLLDSRFSELVK